jgi:hypothetical protein
VFGTKCTPNPCQAEIPEIQINIRNFFSQNMKNMKNNENDLKGQKYDLTHLDIERFHIFDLSLDFWKLFYCSSF